MGNEQVREHVGARVRRLSQGRDEHLPSYLSVCVFHQREPFFSEDLLLGPLGLDPGSSIGSSGRLGKLTPVEMTSAAPLFQSQRLSQALLRVSPKSKVTKVSLDVVRPSTTQTR